MTRIPLPALAGRLRRAGPVRLRACSCSSPTPGTWPTFGLFPSEPPAAACICSSASARRSSASWAAASGASPRRRAAAPTLPLLAASAVPAVLAFVAIRPTPALSCIWLAFGFVVLQAIDVAFQRAGVAPAYWLSLRLPLTAGVIACLLAGALYG